MPDDIPDDITIDLTANLTADLTANGTLSDNNAPEFIISKRTKKIVRLLRYLAGASTIQC